MDGARARLPCALPQQLRAPAPALTVPSAHRLGHRVPSGPSRCEKPEQTPSCSTTGTCCQRCRWEGDASAQPILDSTGAPGRLWRAGWEGWGVGRLRACRRRGGSAGPWGHCCPRCPGGDRALGATAEGGGFAPCPALPTGKCSGCRAARAPGHGIAWAPLPGRREEQVPRDGPWPHPAFVHGLGQPLPGPSPNLSC